jgi:DNA repair exonuclease SbcCD ATPase subunit
MKLNGFGNFKRFEEIANEFIDLYLIEHRKYYIKIQGMFDSGSNINQLKKELDELRGEYNKPLSAEKLAQLKIARQKANEVPKQIADLREKINDLEEKSVSVNLLNQNFNEIKNKVIMLSKENKEFQEQIKQIKDENEKIKSSNYIKRLNLDALQGDIEHLQSDDDLLREKIDDLEEKNTKLRSDNHELESLYYNLLNELSEVKEHARSLSDRVQELETPTEHPPLIIF